MSKNISQQAIATAECAAAAAATFRLSLTQAQLVEHAASLQQEGASADLRALLAEQEAELTVAVQRLTSSTGGSLVESLPEASARLRRAQHDLTAENAFEATQHSAASFETIQRTRTEEVTTIFATGAHGTLMVQLDHESGEVVRDWQTGPGDVCTDLDADWVARMAEGGTHLATITEDHHRGRRDGERLIRPALAADQDRPTVGGVMAFRAGRLARSADPGLRRVLDDRGPQSGQAVAR